jgi:AcrR family transcriptional regulator
MENLDSSGDRPGLRERKKQRTRETIARVALELFAEHGYEETTLAEIAEAADVSTRTIFAYYASKEDILFCDMPDMLERLRQALDQRPEGATTLDALREFMFTLVPPDDAALVRKAIVDRNDALRRSDRARLAPFEQIVAESIAVDLDAQPGDIRPRIVAASLIAAVTALRDRAEHGAQQAASREEIIALLDEIIDFLRGGLDALQRNQPKPERTTHVP